MHGLFPLSLFETFVKIQPSGTPLAASAAGITLSSIPQIYKHLLCIFRLRSTSAGTSVTAILAANAVGGGQYDSQRLMAQAAVANSTEYLAQDNWFPGDVPAADATGSLFGSVLVLIPDYADATRQKEAFSISAAKWGVAGNGHNLQVVGLGFRTLAAITSLRIAAGTELTSGCQFHLYGIK